MKNIFRILFFPIWIIMMIVNPLSLRGQVLPSESGEEIILVTDRSAYVVEEDLYFAAFYKMPSVKDAIVWSTVLYAELIRWDGLSLVQTKVPIKDNYAEGMIKIPENLKSGNYYLRAYTRWMKNYGPGAYSYLMIKVINPYSEQVDKGPDTIQEYFSVNNVELPVSKSIKISGLDSVYAKRERVQLELEIMPGKLSGNYTFCVSRSCGNDRTSVMIKPNKKEEIFNSGEEFLLPEISGPTLSGKIIDKNTGDPVINLPVYLSSALDPYCFTTGSTDNRGEFIFSLPGGQGDMEFCVTGGQRGGKELEILINNEFCTRQVTLPYVPFEINDNEVIPIKEMAINAQLTSRIIFPEDPFPIEGASLPFYGSPTRTIREKEFIELDNLKEFFYEVVPEVIVGFSEKNFSLKILSNTSLAGYPPLVLLDNVPVLDMEQFLSIKTRKIERIEIINKGYIIGEGKYSGVLAVYSENQDLAGLELNENSLFLKYKLFGWINGRFPAYDETKKTDYLPDRRNLLYWQSGIVLAPGKKETISFYTGDAAGEYVIHLFGIDEEGIPLKIEGKELLIK